MLQDILNVLDWLKDTLTTVVDFLVSTVTGFVEILRCIPGVLSVLTSSIAYLPDVVQVFAILTIVICVLYLIAGRDTGGD